MRYLYKITNLINGKCYIGQTKDIKKRFIAHRRKTAKSAIGRAIQKYGKENFSFEQLSICSDDIVDIAEVAAISYYNSLVPNGYNLDVGGMAIRKLSEETKRKISEKNKGKKRSEEFCKKMSIINTGKKHSEETKQKMRGKIPWNKGKKKGEN